MSYGSGYSINGLLYADADHVTTAPVSLLQIIGGSGFTINSTKIEESDFPQFFDFQSCFGFSISGVKETFRGKTLFSFTLCRGAALDGVNLWATRDTGYFDITADVNCSDISYRGFWVTTYDAGDPTILRPLIISDASGIGCIANSAVKGGPPRGYEGSTTYTLALTDANTVIDVNTSAATTITIPTDATTPFPLGTQITLLQYGTGQITLLPISGGSISVRTKNGLKTTSQWSAITLTKRQASEWILSGDSTA
jgi:hypothetical protein